MVKYTLELQITAPDNLQNTFTYSLNLNEDQENHPDGIFTAATRSSMRKKLQSQTSCKINDANLNKMIKLWLGDIKEGYRSSSITMNLPHLMADNLQNINDLGNQNLPMIIDPDILIIEPKTGALPPLNFTNRNY